jgi:hypothetical protein
MEKRKKARALLHEPILSLDVSYAGGAEKSLTMFVSDTQMPQANGMPTKSHATSSLGVLDGSVSVVFMFVTPYAVCALDST